LLCFQVLIRSEQRSHPLEAPLLLTLKRISCYWLPLLPYLVVNLQLFKWAKMPLRTYLKIF
jgi:hypothetical protein